MVEVAPEWSESERYNVEAKVDEADAPTLIKLSQEQRFSMLQQILEDRFRLRAHSEMRELPDFVLVVDKNETKNPVGACPVDDETENLHRELCLRLSSGPGCWKAGIASKGPTLRYGFWH